MNASTEEQPSSSLDGLKWGIIVLLLIAAIGGNFYYGQESVLLRAIGVVVAVGVAGLIAMQTCECSVTHGSWICDSYEIVMR